jgi:hypothetical protein
MHSIKTKILTPSQQLPINDELAWKLEMNRPEPVMKLLVPSMARSTFLTFFLHPSQWMETLSTVVCIQPSTMSAKQPPYDDEEAEHIHGGRLR